MSAQLLATRAPQQSFLFHRERQMRWALPLLLLILIVGAANDAFMLFRYSFAVGVDGYYYQLQIDSLLNHGHLYFPTHTPLILYFLSGLSYLTGNPIVAVKVTGIFLHAVLGFGIFSLLTSATRSVWLGLCGVALSVASGTHFYYVGEYVNNLGALTLLVWGGWCALRFFQTQRKLWLAFAGACFLAACFSHRSAWAILLLIAGSVVAIHLLTMKKSSRRLRFIIASLLLLLWAAPAILAVQPFIQLPIWLRKEFLIIPNLPFSSAAIAEQIILLVIAPATLLTILFFGKEDSRSTSAHLLFGSIALWSLLLTINPFFNNRGAMGFTWRLSILAYIQVALLVPGLIWLLLPSSRRAVVLIFAFVLPIIIGSALFSRPYGLRPAYLADRAELLYRLPFIRQELDPATLVISPHGDQFVVTSTLGIPSQQKWPDNNPYQTTYWLLYHVEARFLTKPMIVLLREKDGTFIVLAKDDLVREQLQEMDENELQRLLSNNSHLYDYVLQQSNVSRR